MQFIFMRDTDGTAPSWYIANFVHRNVSDAAVEENADLLFQYTGLQYSVGAPIDRAFKCCKLFCYVESRLVRVQAGSCIIPIIMESRGKMTMILLL